MECPFNNHSAKLDSTGKGGSDEAKMNAVIQQQPYEGKLYLQNPCIHDYDHALSLFGCGIGWFCFILGFAFPPLWYYATFRYFQKNYPMDPRERPGLAASAIAAFIFTVILLITLIAVVSSKVAS